ncbi:MAG: hypothetical protein PHC99_11775 [Methylococcales bacterium]|nr:hypothetical protein [Methylococcales bacterium]
MRQDFQYLAELIDEFFSDEHITKRFDFIKVQKISGWETWLQIEFANFLNEHSTEPEWARETTLSYDGRKEKEKWLCRPDFIIRKKRTSLNTYVMLEIKQAPSPAECMKLIWGDIEKMSKIRKSELNTRLKCGLAIFHANQVQLHKTITENDLSIETTAHGIIGDTDFAYLLFYDENF